MKKIKPVVAFLIIVLFQLINPLCISSQEKKELFSTITHLKGIQIPLQASFSPFTHEIDIEIKHGKLIYKNAKEHLRIFDIKQRKVIADLGVWGDYPSQFYNPHFCIANEDSVFCYIEDYGNISKITKDYKIIPTKQRIYSYDYEVGGNKVSLVSEYSKLGDNLWLFAGKSSNGFSLFKTSGSAKNIITEELIPLNLYPDKKEWQPYLGYFTISPSKEKAVYAYRYYHAIKFINMSDTSSHLLWQDGKEYDYQTMNKPDGLSLNVSHYLQCYAGNKYVYFLYLGKDNKQLEIENNNTCIYVEQFDWNGNPVNKFRLDHLGYFFCVDEAAKKLYLVGTTKSGSPFYEYDII